MRALVADPANGEAMKIAEVPEPDPAPEEALIEVHHVSLNRGDLNDARSGRVPPGGVLGSDLAGTIARSAANGEGPAAGAGVVALGAGAFAERAAVRAAAIAEVPAGVELHLAAALPVAGLAALRSLRAAGSLLGKRLLVTGASGGVGRFAVQLAAAAGARVIASVGSKERMAGLADAGAEQVTVGLEGVEGALDVVIDSVGGRQMVAAWDLLGDGGNLQSVGWTSGEPAVFEPYSTIGPAKSLTAYLTVGEEVGPDLSTLLQLVERGSLQVPIGWRGPLHDYAAACEALRQRRVEGKAVLDVLER